MKTLLCEEVQNRLSFYVENSLSAVEKTEIEAHLQGCSACQIEAEAYQRLKSGMQALKQNQSFIEPPERVWKQARMAWNEQDARQTRWNRGRVAVVACLLLCLVGISWARRYNAQPFPLQAVLQDYERVALAHGTPKPEMETSDADQASVWLKRQIGGDVPPIPLSLSGAKLIGAGSLSPEQPTIGRLFYQTPKGILILYVAPHRTTFNNTQTTKLDGRVFYVSHPKENMTLLAWEYNSVGLGMMAGMSQSDASPYALDARRLTDSLQ